MHKAVLLQEIISGLNIKDGDTLLDMTLGGGGHARKIFETGKKIKLIGIDQDDVAIKEATKNLEQWKNKITIIKGNFRVAEKLIGNQKVSKILFDLGVSSFQLDEPSRGFSFIHDAALNMKMSQGLPFSAKDIVNGWNEKDIANVIFAYGEEKRARTIAKAIVLARGKHPIETTRGLSKIIERTIPKRGKIHPATKTFQALRIAVNDELNALKDGLKSAENLLLPQGRIAVISFHSLEDRIVKNFMRDLHWKILTKKPITPTKEEVVENPRSRSAKLRIIEKI